MTEDLRRQASELYRERSQVSEIPTSDSLSMKKIVYITLGLLVGLAIIIQVSGGFRPRPDPIVAATAPRPIVKEAPPPELLAPGATGKTEPGTSQAALPASPSAPQVDAAPAPAPPPAAEDRASPARKQGAGTKADERLLQKKERESVTLGAKVPDRKETGTTESSAAAPKPPEVSPVEIARQELARDIVLEKSPALSKLINVSDPDLVYQTWQARPDGTDFYQVTFSFLEKSSNSPIHYVWRVNLTARSVTPLSYYARRLL